MAGKRSRTKIHRGEKIQLNYEFNITAIYIYPSYSSGIGIGVKNHVSEEADAIKLIKFMYKYIDKEFIELEKRLEIKITSHGIFDKNNNIIKEVNI